MNETSRTFIKRAGKLNRHHLLAKTRGGTKTRRNMFLFDVNRHAAYHLLFKNRTFKEAASLLLRAAKMAERR